METNETIPVICDCGSNPTCTACGGLGYFRCNEELYELLTMPEGEYRKAVAEMRAGQ